MCARGAVSAVVLLAFVLLAGCGAAPRPELRAPELRVMTWNVLTSRYDPADWAPVIAAWHPDVVGLQEICAAEAEDLAQRLRDLGLDYRALPGPVTPTPTEDAAEVNAALRGPCSDRGPVTYGLAVLVRGPVTAASVSLFAPDHRDEQRGYQRVELPGLVVVNTHLGLHGVAGPQLATLAEVVAADPRPTVVLGDLNSVDVGRLAGATLDAGTVTRSPTAIDHVLVRGVEVAGVESPEVAVSDHRPVIADLTR